MWESQVSGCQLLACPVLNAQAILAQLRPVTTCPFSSTYWPSSRKMKPLLKTGQYAPRVTAVKRRQIKTVRRVPTLQSIENTQFYPIAGRIQFERTGTHWRGGSAPVLAEDNRENREMVGWLGLEPRTNGLK